MNKRSKTILWVGFFLYGLALFLLLSFYRLPVDRILSGFVKNMSSGKILLSAGNVSSSLWKGHEMEDLTWSIQAGDTAATERMQSLTLSLHFLRLFRGYVPVKVKGRVAGGFFQGVAGVSIFRGLNKGYLDLQVQEIRLEELSALKLLSQRAIRGKLKAQTEVYGALSDLREISGRVTMIVTDGAVHVGDDELGIDSLPFASLTLPFSVSNGVADLKGGVIEGPLFGGDLEGRIRLHHDFNASPLQVTARIRPANPSQGMEAGSLPVLGDRPMVVELQGTVAKPVVSWAGAFQ